MLGQAVDMVMAVAKITEAVISKLGAIFRSLKVGLFISRDGYYIDNSHTGASVVSLHPP